MRIGVALLAAWGLVLAAIGAAMLLVGADLVAQSRNFVHERDTGGEHRVGGVLGHFARAHIDVDHLLGAADKRRVELIHDVAGTFGARADHHAIGVDEVFDRRAFFEEVGIRHHLGFDTGPLRQALV